MRHLSRLALGLVLLLACRSPRAQPAKVPHNAVFILLDGIPADVIEQVDTPALDEIAAAGGYARASVGGALGGRTETPTISAPGYMSLLTATWADKHNVRGNSLRKMVAWHEAIHDDVGAGQQTFCRLHQAFQLFGLG